MNLFHEPSLAELRKLVESGQKSLPVHNIVIDYDGEVIIDPEKKYTGVSLNRFKFHTQISNTVKSNARSMRILFETLLSAYQGRAIRIEMNPRLKSVA